MSGKLPILETREQVESQPSRGKPLAFWRRLLISAAVITTIQYLPWAPSVSKDAHKPEVKEIVYQEGNFTWKPCYENYTCSTLEVPVDYHDKGSPKFELALIKYKATSGPSKGPLFVNPGGPGGSGFDWVRKSGSIISKVVQGQYDIIGFDPRGVGRSNTIRCFKDGTEYKLFAANRPQHLAPGENVVNFAIYKEAVATQCWEKAHDFLPYVSTAFVARDIDALREAFGQELTNYWGFSYGTFLGATYVNMFPDKVGRVLVDGVTDPNGFSGDTVDWMAGSLLHVEDGVDKLGASCEAAGPTKCALAHPDKALAHDGTHYVAPTLRQFLKDLSDNPMLTLNLTTPVIVDQPLAANVLFTSLYKVDKWTVVAKAFSQAIYNGDATGLAKFFIPQEPEKMEDRCPLLEEYWLGASPILCTDGHHDNHPDLDSWMAGLHKISAISPLAVPIWGSGMMDCLYWKAKAAERFAGPWNHTTKNKVLIIGVTGDPVTPIESARILENLMEGSGVLHEHGGWGHCSVGQPSKCTVKVIREYFVHGKVPKKGSFCPMEAEPFEDPVETFSDGITYEELHQLGASLPRFL
ncbi:hypothetical protein BZG36_04097 [Bifiguratus adelaidae]|uniref:AB hydrolase-1 domain-containing protein n=1 Tax=Bifiguratus adelaidae TaxID=1938954 RepID=A0A261XVS1_9FUNG|nr:hypothetical protein BZG36_04097 [Bifiguratus adelaidae]